MRRLISYGAACALALTLLGVAARGQNSSEAAGGAREGVNHDVQLHLLAASNEPAGGGGVPASMEGVIRQLRAALPFSHYRVAATFLNRVRDGGTLEVSGVGGLPLVAGAGNTASPTFLQFHLSNVRLFAGADAQQFIQVERLRFGLKVPVQTASAAGEGGKAGYPVIQYQDTGISTQVSVREGTPTVVGTLAASPPGESFILVITLKRTPTR